jgi:hypothetical protein
MIARLLLTLGLLAATAALAADYHVATGHPAAADTNPGTAERPWKTLSRAASAVKPGDTVHVHPGVYRETVTLEGRGDPDRAAPRIQFLATGDGPVVLQGSYPVTAANVERTDTPRVFRWRSPQPLTSLGVNRRALPMAWVFLGDERLILKHPEPLTRDEDHHFSRAANHVLINLGTDTWPAQAEVRVAVIPYGFVVRNLSNVTIRGFEFREHAANAIELENTEGVVIEDNHIIRPHLHGFYMNRTRALRFRRNRIVEPLAWGANFKGQAAIIEENVFQTAGTRSEPAAEIWVGILKFNGGSWHTVRHNFVADRPPSATPLGNQVRRADFVFGGIWSDVHGYHNRIYGNSVARVSHTGIYLEYMTNHATVMWNTIQDSGTGISTRLSSNNLIRQNWIFDTSSVWGLPEVDFDNMPSFPNRPLDHPEWARERLDGIALLQTAMHPPHPPSYHNYVLQNLVQTKGRAVNIPVPSKMDRATRADVAAYSVISPDDVVDNLVLPDFDYPAFAASFTGPLNNFLDRNLYVQDPARAFAGFAWFLDRQIDSFADYQRLTGLDAHGALGDFKPADIGLQIGWTVQPGSRRPDLPLAYDYDGGAERAVPVSPAVWGRGIWLDDQPEVYSWYRAAGSSLDPGPGHRGRLSYEQDWRRDPRQWTRAPAVRTGLRALGVVNPTDASRIPAGGLGWRTPSIPIEPGRSLAIGAHLKATEIVPQDAARGVEAVVIFTDWTGREVARTNLLPESLRAGSYDWTELSRTVSVPAEARRYFLYFGLHPATGSLLIDDVTYSMVLPTR